MCDPGYWVRHVREAVRFADGIGALTGRRAHVPGDRSGRRADGDGPGLLGDDADAVPLPALRGDRPEEQTLAAALAGLHVRGVTVDWAAYFAGRARAAGPTDYAFDRERHWLEPAVPAAVRGPAADDAAERRFWEAVEHETSTRSPRPRHRRGTATQGTAPRPLVLAPPAPGARGPRPPALRGPWRPAADRPAAPVGGTWLLLAPAGSPRPLTRWPR